MAPEVTGDPSSLAEHLIGPAVSLHSPAWCQQDRDRDLPSCSGSVASARQGLENVYSTALTSMLCKKIFVILRFLDELCVCGGG